jgi:integrase
LFSLPKTLTPEEVEQLVNSLGKPGRSLRRTDAIVRCALDLGLRSGEIAHCGGSGGLDSYRVGIS